jgi:S1-C subfamily serine protease
VNWVDLVIIVAAIAYAFGGYRNGAVVGLFSLAGFFGGAVLGGQLARPLGSHLAGGRSQVPIAIVCVLMSALLGQLVAVWAAGHVRRRLHWKSARVLDSGIGSILGVISVLLVAWMVAVPLASSPYQSLNSAVRRSDVVAGVNDVMPTPVRTLYGNLQRFIDRSGFPQVFGALQPTHIVSVGPPDPALISSAGVVSDKNSVLKILSDAPSCNREIEGSGFVYAKEHVLTNAHVVAGADHVSVLSGSRTLTARVVLYNPQRDVAVLDVPGLTAVPLAFATTPAATNADAVVLGYPENGSFDVRAARVRSVGEISGQDIYGRGNVTRQIYSVRSIVRSGNSGGPLIDPHGQVLGVVFATALDDPDTGFALTYSEIAADAARGATATATVGTSTCT